LSKKGAVLPDESHPFNEIMTLLDGELDLELDTGAKNFSRIGPEKVARRCPSCDAGEKRNIKKEIDNNG
jgi:hypothetical protein